MPKHQLEPEADLAPDGWDDDPTPRRAIGDDPAERLCLSCGSPFLSEGWHNRLCRRCAKRGQPAGTYAAGGASRSRRGRSD